MKSRLRHKVRLLTALAATVLLCRVSASFRGANIDHAQSKIECISNLRTLDGAVQQWAFEHRINGSNNLRAKWSDIRPYLNPRESLACPDGGVYRLRTLAETPTCSVNGHELQ